MLVRLRRRREKMQLGTAVSVSRNHRKRQMQTRILSNANRDDNHIRNLRDNLLFSRDRAELQLLVASLVEQHLGPVLAPTSNLQRSVRQVETAQRDSLCHSASAAGSSLRSWPHVVIPCLSGIPLYHTFHLRYRTLTP